MLSPDIIAKAYSKHGSIRGAARELNLDDHTLRRWANRDQRIADVLGKPDKQFVNYREIEKKPNMKILALDIETRPNLALVWDLWQKHVPATAITQATAMLCWAAKWIGDREISYRSVFHDGNDVMIRGIWDLLDRADAVVHYNGAKFDIPYINMEIARQGLGPPSPYQQIDLLKVVRKNFNFPSNKLVYISKEFGLKGKVDHEGFPLWIKCMNDDPDAWERMKKYNIRDTELLESLYFKLRPWANGVPSYGSLLADDVCPACGSNNLVKRGRAYTRTGCYQRFVCSVCGKWSRAVKRSSSTGITAI